MAVHPAILLGGAAALLLLLRGDDDEEKPEPGEVIPPGGVTDYPFEHCLDEAMPPFMRDQVNMLLSQITDPTQLDAAAAMAANSGFIKAAACLKTKADELRSKPRPVGPDLPGKVKPTIPTPPTLGPMPFTVRTGDYPYGLAQYYTGQGARYTELEPLNPNLGPMVTRTLAGGTGTYQIYENWAPGLKIVLPLSWLPWTTPLPNPGTQRNSGVMPTPGVGA